MKKIYLSLGLVLFLVAAVFSIKTVIAVAEPFNSDTEFCFNNPGDPTCRVIDYTPKGGGGGASPTPSSVPPASGILSFTPSSVKDGGVFTIKLSGAENVPASTVARLWIDPESSGGFKNFGTWLTVGELKRGVQRTMNCSAYSSYDPSGAMDVRGKVLNQRLFISYEGLGYGSEIGFHTKDCSGTSGGGGGGSTPPGSTTPAGSATCSVAPGSATMDQNGTLSFKTSSNQPSTGGNYVYVMAKDFSSGIYSDLGVGKVIPIGETSVDFNVYALTNAAPGNQTFKVYCSTGCPVSGCPSGGSPDVIGTATVNLTVTGTNPSGGGDGGGSGGGSTGSASCSVPNVSLTTNSSLYVPVEVSVGSAGEVSLTGSSSENVSISPVYSSVKYEGGLPRGRELVSAIVRTGPNFTGGSYSLSCDLPDGKAKATAVASLPAVSNPSGKIKLSQVEYLGDTMFPNSECPYDVGGCQQQFYAGNSGPRITIYNGSPVLIGGVERAVFPAPAKGTVTTPRAFSLADPMNPVKIASLDGPSIRPSEDAFGDYGAALSANSVAWSQDGKYRAIVSSQGWLFVSVDGGPKIRVTSGVMAPASIVKSGSEYVLIHGRGAVNITSPKGFENYDEETHDSIPSNFPDIGPGKNYGTKIVSDDGSYVVALPDDIAGRFVGVVGGEYAFKIRLFSASQKEPLAELQLSEDNLDQATKYYNIRYSGKIPFSGGAYIYTLRTLSNAIGSAWVADVFKVEYAAKRITQVAKSVVLPDAYNIGATAGFDVGGGNVGIIANVVINKGGTTNVYGNFEGRFRAFLISDLAAGRAVDVLVNSPVSISGEAGPLGASGTVGPVEVKGDSFSRNNATYMYTATGFGQGVKVWKFEAASGGGSTGGGTPPTTIPPGGTPNTGVGCDFTLTPVPETLTVPRGSSFAVYGLKASDNTDKTCFVSVTAQAIKDSSGNRIISPSSAAATIIGPGMQNIFYFNLSNPPAGSYDIPIKAYARGVATKTLNLRLLVQ